MVNLNRPVSNAMAEHAAGRTDGTASVLYTLCLIALIVMLAGLGLAYAATAWFDSRRLADTDPALAATHLKTVGAQHYGVPAVLMPDLAQHRDGFADRIDLVLALPLGPGGRLSEIEVTIMPRGRAATSAALLDAVYLRQFGAGQMQGPPGLVGKPLEGDAGVTGETVWYDPLSATPFAAKCMAPVVARPEARTCLRTVQLSDRNTAIFAFSPSVLDSWRMFDEVVERWLGGLRR